MDYYENEVAEPRTLGVVAVVYSVVLLAAFAVGMYGLFSLIWLASRAVEQSARAIS